MHNHRLLRTGLRPPQSRDIGAMREIITVTILTALVAGCASPAARRADGYREPGPPYTDHELIEIGFPPSAAHRLLASRPHWHSIVDVQGARWVNHYTNDFLGVSVSIAKSGGWEGVYHQSFILHKPAREPDWRNATIYYITDKPDDLYHYVDEIIELPWEDMQKYITEDQELQRQLMERLQQDESTVPSKAAPSASSDVR